MLHDTCTCKFISILGALNKRADIYAHPFILTIQLCNILPSRFRQIPGKDLCHCIVQQHSNHVSNLSPQKYNRKHENNLGFLEHCFWHSLTEATSMFLYWVWEESILMLFQRTIGSYDSLPVLHYRK